MSQIQKGNYTMDIIDSTGQFSIKGAASYGVIRGGDSNGKLDVNNLIDLLKAYLLAQKRNKL